MCHFYTLQILDLEPKKLTFFKFVLVFFLNFTFGLRPDLVCFSRLS